MTGDYSPEFFASVQDASTGSARRLLPIVFGLVEPGSVVDVGCGTGGWLAVAKELGATRVLGIDGSYVRESQLLIESTEFQPADLERGFEVDDRFDLVISLEVAEHLPPEAADRFLDALTGLADVVLFSAAMPGQSGEGHVNEQWPDFWAARFAERGFQQVDCIRERVWDDPGVMWWYAQNCFLYARPGAISVHAALKQAAAAGSFGGRRLVHPGTFAHHADSWQRRVEQSAADAEHLAVMRLPVDTLVAQLRRRIRLGIRRRLGRGDAT